LEFLWAGLLAAGLVWVVNRFILKANEKIKIMLVIPALEEGAKTGFAILFNAPVFLTHGVFGTVEAIFDVFTTRRKGIAAGVVSYLGHLIFGLLTYLGYKSLNSYWTGLIMAYLAHAFWNVLVMVEMRKGKTP